MRELAVLRLPVFLPGNNRDWKNVEGTAKITEDGEIVIKIDNREDADRLVELAVDGVLMQVSFDYRMTKEMQDKINTRFPVENLKHDDGTLIKVYRALAECGIHVGTEPKAIEVVNALQNAGILFRERG